MCIAYACVTSGCLQWNSLLLRRENEHTRHVRIPRGGPERNVYDSFDDTSYIRFLRFCTLPENNLKRFATKTLKCLIKKHIYTYRSQEYQIKLENYRISHVKRVLLHLFISTDWNKGQLFFYERICS